MSDKQTLDDVRRNLYRRFPKEELVNNLVWSRARVDELQAIVEALRPYAPANRHYPHQHGNGDPIEEGRSETCRLNRYAADGEITLQPPACGRPATLYGCRRPGGSCIFLCDGCWGLWNPGSNQAIKAAQQ